MMQRQVYVKQKRWVLGGIVSLMMILPAVLSASSVLVSWNPNSESDLAGYRIHYGTGSRSYTVMIDVGDTTQYEIDGLDVGATYYFSVTAYDESWNESVYSEELSVTIQDVEAPTLTTVECLEADLVRVIFSELVDETSAEIVSNYQINGVVVQGAQLQTDGKTILLQTTLHANGSYTLTVNNIYDRATPPNTITSNSTKTYSWNGNDETAPSVSEIVLYRPDFLVITFSEPVDQTTAREIGNYTISPAVTIQQIEVTDQLTRVYLTTAPHTPGQSYTLSLTNIRDGASPPNVIPTGTQVSYQCISEDSDPPILLAVRLQSPTELDLEFSEALDPATSQDESNYSISPSVSVNNASLSASKKIVTLTTAAHSGGNYTITVSGVGDDAISSNIIQTTQKTYVYTPPDVTPPTMVSAALASDNLLQVTFSEELEEASAEDVSHYTITPSVAIHSASLHVSGKVILLQTDAHPGGNYRVTVSGIRDRAVNPNTVASNSYVEYAWSTPDVIPPVLLSAELHGDDVVELTFSESLDRSSAENVAHYTITPARTILQAVLVGDSLNHVYLTTQAHQPGQAYTVTVNGVTDQAESPNTIDSNSQVQYDNPLVDNTPPQLSSVELQGDRTLKVTFSEPVTQTTAENPANYTISPSINILEATLDVTQKSVFLKTDTHQPGTNYTLAVQGVTDLANPPNPVASGSQIGYTCVARDVVPPRIVRAELRGIQTVEVTFSEPVDAITAARTSNYTIDNGITISRVTLSHTQTSVFLETSPHQAGTYNLTVQNVQDMASIPNTIMQGSAIAYTYTPADNVAPVLLDVTLSNPTIVELTFSEPLNRTSVENTANYSVSNNIAVERAILDVSMRKVLLMTSIHQPGNYTVTLNNIKDVANNTIAANSGGQYIYETEDLTPPEMVSATLQNENMLILTFNEALNEANAEKKENYVINNGIETESVFLSASGDQVIIETTPHYSGEFLLTVNGVTDASTNLNPIVPYSQIDYMWNPADTVAPRLVTAVLHPNNNLELTFSEPVDAIESQKIANYTIDPPVPIVSAVLHASLDKVWLSTGTHEPGGYSVTVRNVKDRAFTSNTIGAENSAHYYYTPPDTTAPGLVSVDLRSPMVISMVFDEPLTRASAENLGNYTITPNIKVTGAYLLASLTTVHLETDPHQPGVQYSLAISNIRDRSPIPNILREPLVAQYAYTPQDTAAPKLLSAKLHGVNLLELMFSEPLEQISAQSRDNFHIEPMVEVLDASLDSTTLAKVFLQTTAHMPGIGYQVSVQNVRDRAPRPNPISSNAQLSYSMPGAGGTNDTEPPEVAMVDVISSSKVDIVFSEPVDEVTAEERTNYAIEQGVVIESAEIDEDRVRVHLTTSSHQIGKSYAIRVANIQDCARSPNILAAAKSFKYLMAGGVAVSNVNRQGYEFQISRQGVKSYIDRDYTLEQIPDCLVGAIQVITANDDKMSSNNQFMTFELRGEATIYVAYDKRILQTPAWLSGWKVAGEQVVDSRSGGYKLFSMQARNGRIRLGGNFGTLDDNMYMVFVVPQFASGAVLTNLSKPAYQLAHVTVGDPYYIDRDYTIANLPDTLKELLWIRTANDDKAVTDNNFLSFTLSKTSVVHLGYDSRITPLPGWMSDWEKKDVQVLDSRGTRFDIYAKTYQPGEVVLGGNSGTLDDNMYVVLVRPGDVTDGGTESQVPGYFTLTQNFPNPFNPRTTIRFTVENAGPIKLTIFNVLGRRVKVLNDSEMEVGAYEVVWDGTDARGLPVASGVYIYRIEQAHFAKSRRMLLLK